MPERGQVDDGQFVFRQTLRPSTAAGEGFGSDVDVHGDVALVGTSNANNGAGSVFVFHRVNGVWREQQELVASDAQEQARFGSAVALHDSIAVIGAPEQNAANSELPRGQAYVFARAGGFWFEQQRFIDDRANATLGEVVETVGAHRLAVTLNPFDRQEATVRLFERRDGHWSLTATLTADPLPSRIIALDSFRSTLVAGDAFGNRSACSSIDSGCTVN